MTLAEKRRIRDRKFVPYIQERHLPRAFSVTRSAAFAWDLFSPIGGYKPFNAKAKFSYTVSHDAHQRAWSKSVISRDSFHCTNCNSSKLLEAHHIWPQGSFQHLRYVTNVGITLCRPCHDRAYHAPEISPGQFLQLTQDCKEINSIIESSGFWSYHSAGISKGRAIAYGLVTPSEAELTSDEWQCFLTWAKLNNFIADSLSSATHAPITDDQYRISESIHEEIRTHVIES